MKRISLPVAHLLLAVLLCAVTLDAQQPLQQRISVTYQGAAAASVFHAVADVLRVRLQLDPTVNGAVTLDVRNVSVETVLRAVCESIGCRWRIDAGALVVDRDAAAPAQGESDPLGHVVLEDVFEVLPVDILWNDAPLGAAIKALARMVRAEPVIDAPLMEKRISLTLTKRSVSSALNAICEQAGCRWRFTKSPSRSLRVIEAPKPQGAPANPPSANGIARLGDPGVKAPRLLSAAHPRYTDEARRQRIQGVAVVECVVAADGTVGDAWIVKSLDRTFGLDAEALAAARLYVFAPGTKDGNAIAVIVPIEMSFTVR